MLYVALHLLTHVVPRMDFDPCAETQRLSLRPSVCYCCKPRPTCPSKIRFAGWLSMTLDHTLCDILFHLTRGFLGFHDGGSRGYLNFIRSRFGL
ncbi:hypothetical protein MPTK1_5g24010 [Marchantia polymorpha subsp. ruderalis]|uniref:Uncharacterized protein n=2 Tax=Marchantia polymorpha TaxID=3197 RepID=A0AAF6BLN8_MARPO|nr:hypothetical protein MARPO_0010s0055 [Marchantia polymorpha]BBN12922.1 hypothetical protein Mp_5g24010 [Marchantia polymorpha subsp. ruderalis]|eukprot:PTQ46650.1 hypothetical protein MARPO_0010s0055 [Marchantia polymorpha]